MLLLPQINACIRKDTSTFARYVIPTYYIFPNTKYPIYEKEAIIDNQTISIIR